MTKYDYSVEALEELEDIADMFWNYDKPSDYKEILAQSKPATIYDELPF